MLEISRQSRTGLTFLNEAEIKKKNSLELSIKNFDSRILGKAKIIKGKKNDLLNVFLCALIVLLMSPL